VLPQLLPHVHILLHAHIPVHAHVFIHVNILLILFPFLPLSLSYLSLSSLSTASLNIPDGQQYKQICGNSE
jgi:hypothetical protein